MTVARGPTIDVCVRAQNVALGLRCAVTLKLAGAEEHSNEVAARPEGAPRRQADGGRYGTEQDAQSERLHRSVLPNESAWARHWHTGQHHHPRREAVRRPC